MATLVTDPLLERQLKAERAAIGADRYDEVWEGTYLMNPLPNDEHQEVVAGLTSVFQDVIGWPKLGMVRPGVNISDRVDDWTSNYRVPDVAVFLNGCQAENHGAFWLGGPDFAVEVVSPDDRSRDKLDFYGQVGVRELLIVDRGPWQLELFRLIDQSLQSTEIGLAENEQVLTSQVLPLTFQLVPDDVRPSIRVIYAEGSRSWEV